MVSKIINSIIKISIIALSVSIIISSPSASLSKEVNFIEIGNKYYKSGEWREAIRCYKQYIDSYPEDKMMNKDLLYKIASTYFYKLKTYYKALKSYQEIIEKYPKSAEDEEILKIVKTLSRDIDKNGFNYAERHDLGLSVDASYIREINKLLPAKSEIEYVYSGSSYSPEFKYFKIIQENNEVILQDVHGKKIKSVLFNDFAFFWLKLQLTEYLNYEDIGFRTRYIYAPKEINILPIISSDGSYAQINIKTDKLVKKLHIINPNIAETDLKQIIEIFNDFYKKLQIKE